MFVHRGCWGKRLGPRAAVQGVAQAWAAARSSMGGSRGINKAATWRWMEGRGGMNLGHVDVMWRQVVEKKNK